MSIYSMKPTVVLQSSNRRSRLQREERGEAMSENELDLHIEDVLRWVALVRQVYWP